MIFRPSLDRLGFDEMCSHVLEFGQDVDTGHWQAMKDVPMTKTRELLNVDFQCPINDNVEGWANYVEPNLPWAEDQFQERVAGKPVNPGETYKDWPYYKGNVEKHKEQGQFSHTYMERFWARDAICKAYDSNGITGIRYRYGDLNDVLGLLAREPYTRQAYLPIFFPEDTGAHHGERIPCTLGYHLMLREGKLHCFYPIRSCDLLRHFKDDVYMAGRLVQWVLEELSCWEEGDQRGDAWEHATPGNLTMFIPSLHVFEGDLPSLRRKYGVK